MGFVPTLHIEIEQESCPHTPHWDITRVLSSHSTLRQNMGLVPYYTSKQNKGFVPTLHFETEHGFCPQYSTLKQNKGFVPTLHIETEHRFCPYNTHWDKTWVLSSHSILRGFKRLLHLFISPISKMQCMYVRLHTHSPVRASTKLYLKVRHGSDGKQLISLYREPGLLCLLRQLLQNIFKPANYSSQQGKHQD